MSGLLPIIRRVRRPLLPVDEPVGGNSADAKPVVGSEVGAQAAVLAVPPPAVPTVAPNTIQLKRKEQRGKAAGAKQAQ